MGSESVFGKRENPGAVGRYIYIGCCRGCGLIVSCWPVAGKAGHPSLFSEVGTHGEQEQERHWEVRRHCTTKLDKREAFCSLPLDR